MKLSEVKEELAKAEAAYERFITDLKKLADPGNDQHAIARITHHRTVLRQYTQAVEGALNMVRVYSVENDRRPERQRNLILALRDYSFGSLLR